MRPELQVERGLLSPKDFKLGYSACPECNTVKPLDAFHRSKQRISGRTAKCGECRSRIAREKRKVEKAVTDRDAGTVERRGRIWE